PRAPLPGRGADAPPGASPSRRPPPPPTLQRPAQRAARRPPGGRGWPRRALRRTRALRRAPAGAGLRLGPLFALAALATALLAGPRVGVAAGAILALTPGFVRFANTLLLDPTMLLAALLGLLAAVRAWEHGGTGLWRAGAWFGVAFLAKGALALVAAAILPA